MDWNSRTTTEWDWDNLGFSTKTVDASKHVQNHEIERDNGSVYSSGGICFSSSDLGHGSSSKSSISASCDSSLREGIRTFRSSDGLSKDFSQKELTQFDGAGNFPLPTRASASFGEPMIGLKLGKRTYFEDVSQASTSSISGTPISSTATTKRSRANYETTLSPRCQVEGCNLDLKMAKDYHRRHRICENHSKSPKVIVAGMERRFCQQCSRFHELSEFDDKKRSCRRRLSDHNARRRRPQPETIQFNSARMSSSLYDGRQQMNIVFNRVPLPAANPVWESACNFKDTQAEDCLIRPAKAGGIYRQMNLPLNVMPDATSMLQIRAEKVLSFEGSTPQVFSQALESSPFASDLDVAPDLQRALSLLSTNSWGLNKPEPTSLDPFMLENQTLVAQPVSHGELQNWTVVSAEHEQGDQSQSEPRMHSNLHDNRSIHFQEFQLFKAPYDPGCFYSSQIN